MQIRIGSGRLRGSTIVPPAGKGIRPPLARIRKSIFDMLAARLAGGRVLDLYAGSGSFGIEAVSRGADSAVMVERGREAARVIGETARRLEILERVIILESDVAKALDRLALENAMFDIIFMDPPFADYAPEVPIRAASLLADGGILLWRMARKYEPPARLAGLEQKRIRTYGISKVCIYEGREE